MRRGHWIGLDSSTGSIIALILICMPWGELAAQAVSHEMEIAPRPINPLPQQPEKSAASELQISAKLAAKVGQKVHARAQ